MSVLNWVLRSLPKGLKAAGKKVYLLSNAQRIFTESEMNVLNIARHFDSIYFSSDYQAKKPDRRFFDALINEKQIDVKRALLWGMIPDLILRELEMLGWRHSM